MSNRLSFAHVTTRREPHEWMAAPQQTQGLATAALNWLRSVGQTDEMPAAMRRDLGLPEAATGGVSFADEIERSRVRV